METEIYVLYHSSHDYCNTYTIPLGAFLTKESAEDELLIMYESGFTDTEFCWLHIEPLQVGSVKDKIYSPFNSILTAEQILRYNKLKEK